MIEQWPIASNLHSIAKSIDNLKSIKWRLPTSLRFHNVPSENCTDDTDSVVVKICQEMGVNINTDDINRSHPIGRPRNNKRQIICRFRNWKIKNQVYSAKKQLKTNSSNIFVTEDLTKYRQNIVSKIIEAKKAKMVHSFWTYDGRIFIKLGPLDQRHEVTSLDDLYSILETK